MRSGESVETERLRTLRLTQLKHRFRSFRAMIPTVSLGRMLMFSS